MHASTPSPSSAPDRAEASGTGRAHAKSILIGEHAAVYGAPAVAIPVHGLRSHAHFDDGHEPWLRTPLYDGPVSGAPEALAPVITAWRHAAERFGLAPGRRVLTVASAIPIQRGLGSSAAVAAAVIDAVAREAGLDPHTSTRHELIQRAETVAHGNPSGIDAATVAADGPILFQRGTATPIATGAPLSFVIADTGVQGSTAVAIGLVRSLRESNPRHVDGAIARLTELATDVAARLEAGSARETGDAMSEAHEILRSLGVSADPVDTLVRAAGAAGALGAKLTGGGLGGCVIALSPTVDTTELQLALRAAGAAATWTTTVEARA
ncbi:mevalonate kinase [Pseudoclavibacter chungangensis]|uniref:Mevalonate kinase n=1 Tax=Pseudoclavibacter chungangensis TaxID=587635 RepID=A0A7J5BUC2_9MICO|nr:mevalonate kinase [Pseudoclavibacter chungangensis]KAB1657957.1 mevalonate kinase [Pseudoclavibacter chungangensis]NYJ65889.1 mevalonate kinase [Pseudoclavibacter chungangensis]